MIILPKQVHEGLITGAGFVPFSNKIDDKPIEVVVKEIVKKKPVSKLDQILIKKVDGFKRFDIFMDECKVAKSKTGVMRNVILIPAVRHHRKLQEAYIAATRQMILYYKLGNEPIVQSPYDPRYRHNFYAIYNHVKPIPINMFIKYLEFIHIQAELLYDRIKSPDISFSWHYHGYYGPKTL